jgi:hypothetical protein
MKNKNTRAWTLSALKYYSLWALLKKKDSARGHKLLCNVTTAESMIEQQKNILGPFLFLLITDIG